MKIWLNDLRQPLPEYVWVRSVGEAKRVICDCEKAGIPIEELSLDYDLGEYELDGAMMLYELEELLGLEEDSIEAESSTVGGTIGWRERCLNHRFRE